MEWIDHFEKSLLDLDSSISEFSKSNPALEDACMALSALNRIKADFGVVYEQLAKIVSDLMGDIPEVMLQDGSKIEKRSASDRKSWMHQDLAREVAKRLNDMSIDMSTGEKTMTSEEMVVKVLDFVQPSYWRVKALGEIGITADKFCEVSEAKESIIVRKAK